MKVILKESVQNLGTVGDVVAVKDGYARNYLLPRGFAILADPRNVQVLEHHRKALEKKRLGALKKAEELAAALSGVRLAFQRKASDQNQLFGSVTHIDIEKALADKGFTINRKQVVLEQPIKALGECAVKIKLDGGVKAEIRVAVEKETED